MTWGLKAQMRWGRCHKWVEGKVNLVSLHNPFGISSYSLASPLQEALTYIAVVQERMRSGSSTDLVTESWRPSKCSCRIHWHGHNTVAVHPSESNGGSHPIAFPSGIHIFIFYSSQFMSYHRSCGNVANILMHDHHFFWEVFLLSQGYIPLLCARMMFFSPAQHFSHL